MVKLEHIDSGPDTFRIMLTTDNHIGYMETDPIRGNDSWQTFSEIMHTALDEDVDMVVQGGDLFHVNQPSKKSYYHVMRILRECCWNDKPIEYRLVSDPSNAMATKHFNYPCEYDDNINVGMPIYAISGNHDDATGDELLSPLDLLSVSGMLNHFGKVTDNDKIEIYPLLFNKGRTNLALYGFHSIREERLMKTMASGNLEFLEPDAENEEIQWFNLMCIHQNHVHRPGVKVVEETSLPTFLDFILWGHEHDCIPSVMQNSITGNHILQAGSSIATSLNQGETLDKHVFILSVKGKDFSLKPIRLKSVRPFVMRDVVLSETGLSATTSNKNEVLNFLIFQVDAMIEKAKSNWKENNKEFFEDEEMTDLEIPLPLIRLRVEYSGGYDVENPRFFSNRFVGRVANVNDVITFHQRRKGSKLLLSKEDMLKSKESDDEKEEGGDEQIQIISMIEQKLNDDDLIMISKDKYASTLDSVLTKEDNAILAKFVRDEQEEHLELMKDLSLEENRSEQEIGVPTDVKNVKKTFKELVKRIKAETQYSENKQEKNSGPIRYSAPVTISSKTSGPITYSTPLQSNESIKKIPKSNSFVVDSNSDNNARDIEMEKNISNRTQQQLDSVSIISDSSMDEEEYNDLDVIKITKPTSIGKGNTMQSSQNFMNKTFAPSGRGITTGIGRGRGRGRTKGSSVNNSSNFLANLESRRRKQL